MKSKVLPDFLLTSQSRLINAGLCWNTLAASSGAWHLPPGSAEYDETNFFNKSDSFHQTKERALALNLQPLDRPGVSPEDTAWH